MDGNMESPKDRFDDKIDSINERKVLLLQWRNELDENEAVNPFFEPYREGAKKNFLDAYIHSKYGWHKYGDMYQKIHEARRELWIDEGHKQLEAILQKKLFDLQCLWRAEQLTFKEIEICYDFEIWENDVFNCPFLDLITEEEIDLYHDFLMQDALDRNDIEFDNWQNYDEIKEGNQNIEESYLMPEWYDYHNSRTGKGVLLLMGDIRGEKEDFYMNLVHEKERKEKPEQYVASEPRPYFNYLDDEVIKFFVTTFEDETAQKNYHQHSKLYLGSDNDAMRYYELLEELNGLHDLVPVPSHYDFREALEKGYNRYYLNKIAEHLPIAYEQYLFHKKMGLSFESKKDEMIDVRVFLTKRILKGRELNGEERNFNF
ncbi:MAG: hypothetical protein H7239_02790 [Flavobacterium sp.]|nr:hypothetical protein [Flavobacterium sp.]